MHVLLIYIFGTISEKKKKNSAKEAQFVSVLSNIMFCVTMKRYNMLIGTFLK